MGPFLRFLKSSAQSVLGKRALAPAFCFEVYMQFEVKGQSYFLNYLDDEGRWILLRPSSAGIQEIPVEEDSAQPLFGGVMIQFGEEGQSTIH